jgi:hypothetical protein
MENKDFVPYEEALGLKELGFDEPCFMNYFNYTNTNGKENIIQLQRAKENIFGENYFFKNSIDNTQNENSNCVTNHNCSAPTFSQAFRWFRDNHKIMYPVDYNNNDNFYGSFTRIGGNYFSDFTDNFNTYEEAELASLRKLINIAKIKLELLQDLPITKEGTIKAGIIKTEKEWCDLIGRENGGIVYNGKLTGSDNKWWKII